MPDDKLPRLPVITGPSRSSVIPPEEQLQHLLMAVNKWLYEDVGDNQRDNTNGEDGLTDAYYEIVAPDRVKR